jgi:glycerophosphoryl diester phosphodiesterase
VAVIAHRGGAAEGYENTIEAFRRAVGRGAGMLELDVHLSKDQRVVVAHDQVCTFPIVNGIVIVD